MIKAPALRLPSSLFVLLACSLGGACGCQGDAEPAPGNAAGSASGGAGGSPVGTPVTAGTAPSGGSSSSSAGSAGQATSAGSNTGGAAAGAAQGGQAGSSAAGASGNAGSGGTSQLPPLEECTSPSVDRLTQWSATNEGTMVPASGSILVKEGADYVGKVQFVGGGWHVVPVLIANKFDVTADLSKASGITLTYSATAELHVQLRSKSHWSGGDQYATTLPSTGGKTETHVFSFAAAGWKSLFGTPVLSFADTLKESMGLVFVGDGENTIAFYGLRIDGYSPPCP